MAGCSLLPSKPAPVVFTKIVKVSPPSYLYTDCGSGKISELTSSSTIADMLVQSLERQNELDKCIEVCAKLKQWSESE